MRVTRHAQFFASVMFALGGIFDEVRKGNRKGEEREGGGERGERARGKGEREEQRRRVWKERDERFMYVDLETFILQMHVVDAIFFVGFPIFFVLGTTHQGMFFFYTSSLLLSSLFYLLIISRNSPPIYHSFLIQK